MITVLRPNQIIVIGTNADGIHAGGAAYQAWQDFGALMGYSTGPIGGQSWGIVTLDKDMEKANLNDISDQIETLYKAAGKNPDKEFLVTKIGCGIAGFSEDEIRPLFKNPPENVILPEDW